MRLTVLGSVEVAGDDGALAIRPGKQRILLATLAAHAGRTVATDKLVESLWADPPASAWENLRLHIFQLRKVVGSDRLLRRPGGYALVTQPGELDSEEFDHLITEADRLMEAGQMAAASQVLASALALWRGPAYGELAGLPLVQQSASRLNESRLLAMEQRVTADLGLGKHAELIPELVSTILEHPLRERLRGHLMLALYRSGRQAEALRVYRDGREIMVTELGIEPGAELRALHEAILREDVPRVPGEATSFVGRKVELFELRRLLSQHALTTLVGVGGVGKTRLAMRLAADASGVFPDGVFVAELAAVRDSELALIRALGLVDQSTSPPLQVLQEHLKDKRLLLVVDTCEHLVDDVAATVRSLLECAPDLRIVATSRQPLHVEGERLYHVQALSVPDAVRLFRDRAQAATPDFAVADGPIEALCGVLDGIPLALELAAAQVRSMSIGQINQGLHDLPAETRRQPRHQTLRKAMAWSYQLCTPAERLMWARASVFAGSFDLDAVSAVCCDDEVSVQALAGLVDKSVLYREDSPAGSRYVLLDMLRHFGAEQLQEELEVRRRLCQHYLNLARRFEEEWHGSSQVDWCERMRGERPNIEAVLEFCNQDPQERDTGLELAAALWSFWSACGLLREGRHYLDRLLAHAPPSPHRIKALWACGHVAIGQGDLDATEAMAREARASQDPFAVAFSDQLLGTAAALRGDTETGARLTGEAVRRFRQLASPGSALSVALVGNGFSLLLKGDLDAAARVLAELSDLCATTGEVWTRAWGDYIGAQVELLRGAYEAAAAHARASLETRIKLNDRLGMAASLDVLAQVAAESGDGPRAAVLLGIGTQMWNSIGLGLFRSAAMQATRQNCERQARLLLGGQDFLAAEQEGLAMDPRTGLTYALGTKPITAPQSPVPAQLPPDVARFVGRKEELRRLNQLLEDPPVLIGLTGLGGSGKSGLAVRWAHSVVSRFPHGQLFIDLRGAHGSAEPVSPGHALDRFLRALGVPGTRIPADVDDRAALFRSSVASKRILIVLDNAHNSAQVRPLLPGSSGCAVIVTSRDRLDGLAAKEGAAVLNLTSLNRADSLALLSAHGGTSSDHASLERVGELCAGLPLALRIAAARLATRAHLTPAGLASRLDDERLRLDELEHGDAQVRAGFELSYRDLPELAGALFRRAAQLNVADFPAWLVAPMVAADVETATDLLEQLVDAHLLDVAEPDAFGAPRYRFHDLVRVYAREQARAEENENALAAVARSLGCLLAIAERAHRREYGGDFAVLHGTAPRWRIDHELHLLERPLEWLASERHTLVQAVAQAAALGLDELAWDLAMTSVTLFESHNLYEDWEWTHEVAMAATRRNGNVRGEAAMLYGLGSLALFRHDHDTAGDLLQRSTELFAQVGEEHGYALALRNMALLHRIRGDYDAALSLYGQAKELLSGVGDSAVTAHVLANTAQIHLDKGNLDRATSLLDTALSLFQEIGNQRGQAQVLYHLGEAWLRQKRPAAARTCFAQALPLVRELGDKTGEAHILRGSGQAALEVGRIWEAERDMTASLRIAEANGERFAQARAWYALGAMYNGLGDARAAKDHLERAISLFTAIGDTVWLARALSVLE